MGEEIGLDKCAEVILSQNMDAMLAHIIGSVDQATLLKFLRPSSELQRLLEMELLGTSWWGQTELVGMGRFPPSDKR